MSSPERALPDDWTLPEASPITAAWFTSGTLVVQTCGSCGTRQHPPEEICHHCGALEFTTSELAPRGTVHSHTVVHHPAHPALADRVPYVVVLVALDDDPTIRVVGNLVDAPVETVEIGMPVRCVWTELADEDGTVLLPQWTTPTNEEVTR